MILRILLSLLMGRWLMCGCDFFNSISIISGWQGDIERLHAVEFSRLRLKRFPPSA